MTKLKIITVPSKTLRNKSQEVKKIDKKVSRLISDMLETMHHVGGLGISAPQVGESLRIAIIESKGGKRKDGSGLLKIPLTVIINPRIIKCSKKKEIGSEGCLSVPDVWGDVERFKEIQVEALDEKGQKRVIGAKDLFARALQHEIDHMDGILFTDKADYATLHKIGPGGEKLPIDL